MKSKKIKVFRCPVVTSVYFCNYRRAAQNCLAGRMLPTPGFGGINEEKKRITSDAISHR